ncbi:MAG: bifunctional aspartate kinase/homoserine dehydrogenase I [Ferruginibacter sp.]|nr:bifunctional aspartate kinase/homoserine dehydrogenase I [Ferruginibacter sp.]
MQVLKFGGSSVANAANINKVVNIIKAKQDNGKTIIVVSALGGITDKLLKAAQLAECNDESYKLILNEIENIHLQTVKELVPVQQQSPVLSLVKKMCNEVEDICDSVFILHELSPRIKDWVLSFGELLSSQIIAAKLNASGMQTEWKDSREIIVTDNHFGKATVDFSSTNKNASTYFQSISTNLFIIPGFIAADKNNITTTLGRGGSDYTAAIIAAAVDAKVLEIWTDVSGMMTADPRLVSNSKHIPQITYQEAMELSHFGAKVIYPPTMQPVMKKKIPVWIKNTFLPDEPGTVIENEATGNRINIQGISSINNIVLLSLEGSGMVGIPGFSKRLFEALANAAINVILITQGSSEHSICVGIDEHASVKAKEAVDMAFAYEIETGRVDPIIVEKHLSIVAIVGDKMKNHSGISGKMFSALGRNGISIRAIAQGSSERNISAVISTQDVKKAINVLHEAFFETTYKQVNLFIAGLGNVGKRFLDQLQLQKEFLKEHLRMQVRVVGIANSKNMCFNEEGIDLSQWQTALQHGQPMSLEGFATLILSKNLRNTVFADITANEEIAGIYSSLLQKSISVIACNKVAASSSFNYYNELKELAKEYNCQFLFETNVGAGLPIIGTLKDLMQSGDSVHRIEAVLSGTLNFVFNKYNGTKSFASVVKQAQEEGYTEPDPRLDLSGKDVVRKILILARECGEKLEAEDIYNNSFMPQSCMKGSVNDFYAAMEKEEIHFKKLLDEANLSGKKLKFIASYDNGKASVGLKQVDERSDFFHLYGKDNVVLFYTDRYPEQPLVIKGAGAGAEVTASGVFADLLRATAV